MVCIFMVGVAGLEDARHTRVVLVCLYIKWSGWPDSNRRPHGPKPRTLPTEPHPEAKRGVGSKASHPEKLMRVGGERRSLHTPKQHYRQILT